MRKCEFVRAKGWLARVTPPLLLTLALAEEFGGGLGRAICWCTGVGRFDVVLVDGPVAESIEKFMCMEVLELERGRSDFGDSASTPSEIPLALLSLPRVLLFVFIVSLLRMEDAIPFPPSFPPSLSSDFPLSELSRRLVFPSSFFFLTL
jgi:hypothetical protein